MFKQFIEKVSGADIYLVSSMLVFILFFLIVTIWLIKADKKQLHEMNMLPLNDTELLEEQSHE